MSVTWFKSRTKPAHNSGQVVEVLDHISYIVRKDGSGRISKRNRRFLGLIKSYRSVLSRQRRPVNQSETDVSTPVASKRKAVADDTVVVSRSLRSA